MKSTALHRINNRLFLQPEHITAAWHGGIDPDNETEFLESAKFEMPFRMHLNMNERFRSVIELFPRGSIELFELARHEKRPETKEGRPMGGIVHPQDLGKKDAHLHVQIWMEPLRAAGLAGLVQLTNYKNLRIEISPYEDLTRWDGKQSLSLRSWEVALGLVTPAMYTPNA